MKQLFITFLLLGLIGCDSPQESANRTFYPLEECREVTDIDSYVDSIAIICSDVCMSDISKVLTDARGNFYILDMRGELHILNPNGTPSDKGIRRGRATNEYMQIEDIALSDDELLLLDGMSVKCFDLNSLQKSREISIAVKRPFDAIAPDKDGGVYLFSSYSAEGSETSAEKNYLLCRLDRTGTQIAQDIPYEDCTFSIGNITQSRSNTYYLRPQNNRHVFYRLTEEGAVPEYRIDFGAATIPDRYYYNVADEDIRSYMKADYFKLPIYFHETATHLTFCAAGPEAEEYNFVYDKRSGRGIRWCSRKGDPAVRICAADEEAFYLLLPNFICGNTDNSGPLVKAFKNKQDSTEEHNGLIILKLIFGKI